MTRLPDGFTDGRRRAATASAGGLVMTLVVVALLLLGSTAPGWAAGSSSPGPTRSPASGQGILLSRAEIMGLPTSGAAWAAIMARVDAPVGGSYRLGTRDDSHNDVLAYALAAARLDDDGYRDFVRDKVSRVMAAPRRVNDVLGTLRHLQAYVISADLIGLAELDPALDRQFRRWLAEELRFRYAGGGGGGSVVSIHDTKPNNFGTHAGASPLAVALYLGNEYQYRAARDVWYGWATGNPDFVPDKRVWSGTDWQCERTRQHGINPAGCERDGHRIDGVIPEDQARCGEFSWPPCRTNYIHGAADGMTLSFWMLTRNGEDPWSWGDRAALRQMQWKYANGQPPYDGFRWQIPVIERAYGIDLPGNEPTAASTNVGFADWWAPALRRPSPSTTDRAPPAGAGPADDTARDKVRDEAAGTQVGPAVLVIAGLVLLTVVLLPRRRRRARHAGGGAGGPPSGGGAAGTSSGRVRRPGKRGG